jgi:hypothetical protein
MNVAASKHGRPRYVVALDDLDLFIASRTAAPSTPAEPRPRQQQQDIDVIHFF